MKVDIPSGGDIDGCLKQDAIDEFKGEIRKPNLLRSRFQGISEAKAMLVLNHEEAPLFRHPILSGDQLDEKHCKEVLKQPKPKTKTWAPWLVLKERGDILVVERITKTGKRRPDYIHKSLLEVVA